MLSVEENERITRVGPKTPGGEYLRRFWWPACLSSELPENDGAPLRVRLLGEDLVAFRDTEGKIGLLDAYCPHRRAPLFFGRNEECGLRCVYHGWKFDRNGTCVDMPSEPAGTTLQAKVRLNAYPVVESGGLVWAYMGPKEEQPPEPDYEWLRAPPDKRHVSKTFENCNWLQGLEGGLDTAHSSFAHNNHLEDMSVLRQRDKSPRIDVERTDYGYTYVSRRDMGEEGTYVRVYQYLMPSQQMRANTMGWFGGRNVIPRLDGHIWVPIDDTKTFVYNWFCVYDQTIDLPPEWIEKRQAEMGRGSQDMIPGTFRLKRNQSNDYLIDRQVQKTQTFTGITGINTQDFALQEGMGPICDRSKEFLGTSDKAIVAMRRLLLEAIDTVQKGGRPRGTDPESYRLVRPHDRIVPPGQDWRPIFEKELVARW
ncbi:MAG: aromatic ring-hydroxylating dioxygenase subunit alpha [Proteobacteria bacterium]|nr:aromatic ring-hydroxylating dioxygenase subunit alpha [Pseudomonadota bacterium]